MFLRTLKSNSTDIFLDCLMPTVCWVFPSGSFVFAKHSDFDFYSPTNHSAFLYIYKYIYKKIYIYLCQKSYIICLIDSSYSGFGSQSNKEVELRYI